VTSRPPARSPSFAAVGRGRSGYGASFAFAIVLLINGAFVLNNLAPYLGLHYAGAITMFSRLSAVADNHLFMPKIAVSDADTYVKIVAVGPGGPRTSAARELEAFADHAQRQRALVSLNFVRYHAGRVCRASPDVALGLSLLTREGEPIESDDVCAEPSMLRYAILSGYPECDPDCRPYLRSRAARDLPAK
jgi:hypothetical protein